MKTGSGIKGTRRGPVCSSGLGPAGSWWVTAGISWVGRSTPGAACPVFSACPASSAADSPGSPDSPNSVGSAGSAVVTTSSGPAGTVGTDCSPVLGSSVSGAAAVSWCSSGLGSADDVAASALPVFSARWPASCSVTLSGCPALSLTRFCTACALATALAGASSSDGAACCSPPSLATSSPVVSVPVFSGLFFSVFSAVSRSPAPASSHGAASGFSAWLVSPSSCCPARAASDSTTPVPESSDSVSSSSALSLSSRFSSSAASTFSVSPESDFPGSAASDSSAPESSVPDSLRPVTSVFSDSPESWPVMVSPDSSAVSGTSGFSSADFSLSEFPESSTAALDSSVSSGASGSGASSCWAGASCAACSRCSSCCVPGRASEADPIGMSAASFSLPIACQGSSLMTVVVSGTLSCAVSSVS